jgi:hypothetical protein
VNQLKLENEKLNKKTKAKQAELEKRLSTLESKIK